MWLWGMLWIVFCIYIYIFLTKLVWPSKKKNPNFISYWSFGGKCQVYAKFYTFYCNSPYDKLYMMDVKYWAHKSSIYNLLNYGFFLSLALLVIWSISTILLPLKIIIIIRIDINMYWYFMSYWTTKYTYQLEHSYWDCQMGNVGLIYYQTLKMMLHPNCQIVPIVKIFTMLLKYHPKCRMSW